MILYKTVQEDVVRLMQGKPVEEMLNAFLVLNDLERSRVSILTLLCMSGYLNAVVERRTIAGKS